MSIGASIRRATALVLLLLPLVAATAEAGRAESPCAGCVRSCCCRPGRASGPGGPCRMERACGGSPAAPAPMAPGDPALLTAREVVPAPAGPWTAVAATRFVVRHLPSDPPDQPPEPTA